MNSATLYFSTLESAEEFSLCFAGLGNIQVATSRSDNLRYSIAYYVPSPACLWEWIGHYASKI